MKILVAFYSRGGNTKKVGLELAKFLNGQTDEIIDKKDRSGIKGWLGGGKDVLFKKSTQIEFSKNPSDYDLVIVGTPTWMYTATPAVKEYLKQNKFTKLAFFCTHGGNPSTTFTDMERSSQKPLASLELRDKTIGGSEAQEKVKGFCKKLQL